MPELPDLIVYRDALEARLRGRPIRSVRIVSPSLLRTALPPIETIVGQEVLTVSLVGKRLVFELTDNLFLVMHLMIAGRLHWKQAFPSGRRKIDSAIVEFPHGVLLLTEASSKKRASLALLRGTDAIASVDRGGLNPLGCTLEDFRRALVAQRHTLKRALTDPTIVSGIGNAYSDEILHHARLSPLRHTTQLKEEEFRRLLDSMQTVLREWIEQLRRETGEAFPEKVTAFRDGMAVHGNFGKPCPVCGTAVQRIAYAENECNYCPRCQTDGRLLSDRALARLLKEDWPRTIEELEARKMHRN